MQIEPDPLEGFPWHKLSGLGLEYGKYTVGEYLGQGGMGVVYSAWNHRMNTEVVIKFLKKNR